MIIYLTERVPEEFFTSGEMTRQIGPTPTVIAYTNEEGVDVLGYFQNTLDAEEQEAPVDRRFILGTHGAMLDEDAGSLSYVGLLRGRPVFEVA